MAVAPLNKFLTLAVPVAPGEQTIYTAPVGTSAIVLYAQVSNVGIGGSYPTVTFTHRRTSVATRTAGNERNNRIVRDAEIPPSDALILVDGRLVLERTAIVSDSVVLSGTQSGIGTIMNVLYDGTTGVATVRTLRPHGLLVNDEITMAGIAFTCSGTYGLTTSIFPEPQASFKVDEVLNDNTFISDVGVVKDLPHVYRPAFHKFIRSDVGSVSVTGGVLGPFTPTQADYNPENGTLKLTIPGHGLNSPTTHTAGAGTTYEPLSGIMTVTVSSPPSPGFQNGEYVKFEDGSLTFECSYGGATGSSRQQQYPRPGDPASTKFLPISNVSGSNNETFEVDVGEAKGDYNHQFVPGQDSSINSIIFGGDYTHTWTGGEASNVVKDESSSTEYNVEAATYTPNNGQLVLTVTDSTGLSASDAIRIKLNSLTFSCAMDNHATNHTYPRSTDPIWLTLGSSTNDGTWSRVQTCTVDLSAKTITLNVGASPITQYTPTAATYNGVTGNMLLTIGAGYNINRPAPANLTPSDATYNPNTGQLDLEISGHGLHTGDRIIIGDLSLKFTCLAGGGTHSYPRANDPDSRKWLPVTYVDANNITVFVSTSSNTTTHSYVGNIPNRIEVASDSIKIANESIVFTCDKDNYGSKHYYPRPTDPYYNTAISIGSTTSTQINVFVGKSIVNQNHRFIVGAAGKIKRAVDSIKIATNSLTFKCSQDNYATEHDYPRSTDPANDSILGIDVVGVNTISANVGISTAGGLVAPLQMEFICSVLENSTV